MKFKVKLQQNYNINPNKTIPVLDSKSISAPFLPASAAMVMKLEGDWPKEAKMASGHPTSAHTATPFSIRAILMQESSSAHHPDFHHQHNVQESHPHHKLNSRRGESDRFSTEKRRLSAILINNHSHSHHSHGTDLMMAPESSLDGRVSALCDTTTSSDENEDDQLEVDIEEEDDIELEDDVENEDELQEGELMEDGGSGVMDLSDLGRSNVSSSSSGHSPKIEQNNNNKSSGDKASEGTVAKDGKSEKESKDGKEEKAKKHEKVSKYAFYRILK